MTGAAPPGAANAHHVLLISMDALRADALGCLGAPGDPTPALDALAGDAALFSNATSPATWTLPAHMSMLSGLEPPVHGCVHSLRQYPPETLPFPLAFELCEEAGYRPSAITGGGFMDAGFGFGRGAGSYQIITAPDQGPAAVLEQMSAAARTFTFYHSFQVHDYVRVVSDPTARELVQRRYRDHRGFFPTDRNFIGLIRDLGETPPAQRPTLHARDTAYLNDLYRTAVVAADHALAGLVARLRSRGLWSSTTLILCSDHGESLGEVHDGVRSWSHGGRPYREQIQIPLLIKPADHCREQIVEGRYPAQTSLVDLLPTILDLVGNPRDRRRFDGLSLVDLCQGRLSAFETRQAFFHSCELASRVVAPHLHASAMAWRDGAKVVYDPDSATVLEYYFGTDEPPETHNRLRELSREELARITAALTEYEAHVSARAHRPPAREHDQGAVLARLSELGYVE